MPNDVVLQGRVEEMLAVEVEASPLDRGLGSALQQLARGVAEELRDVDPLDLPPPVCPSPKKSEKKSSKRLLPRPPKRLDICSSARSISQRYSTSCVPSGRSRTLDATAGRPCRGQTG